MDALVVYILIGFFAQLVDGSLGMGYKTSSTTFLLSTGLPPAVASASVHTAGVFTSAVSGFAHWRFGNLNNRLIRRLVIYGVMGAIVGVFVVSYVPSTLIRPIIALYLMGMGLLMVARAITGRRLSFKRVQPEALGAVGGFCDAIGGGGWGPIVTGTLINEDGRNPRRVIGSVNVAEWFVTVAQATTFLLVMKEIAVTPVLGLIIGGVPAAPFAAYAARKLPVQKLTLGVGILLIILAGRTLLLALGVV
jgi:uncharacterized membrane protein YfcA